MLLGLEHINCPYCGKNESKHWATQSGYTAVKCIHCAFVYVNPRPTMEEINNALELGSHETVSGRMNTTGNFRRYRVNGFKKRLLELFPGDELKGREVRWLDIGAGFGELLLALKEITGKRSIIEGIEPNTFKLEKAKQFGLNIEDKLLNEINSTYDFLSIVDVFSHVPNPFEFISEIEQKIDLAGEIILVTGNGGDIQADEYPGTYRFPDHLSFGGEKHIIGILEQTGFEVIDIKRYRDTIPVNIFIRAAVAVKVRSPIWNKGPYRSLWIRARRQD